MSDEKLTLLNKRPCKHLRSKEMFYDTGDQTQADEYASGIFWCMHSDNCLGPDGLPADDEDCAPASNRECLER